jgi:F-type H+-transporting ATPase subunit b
VIDWFTVVAQIFNFLLLVFLLKRFLYKPVMDTIDARDKTIADKLKDADAKKADAQKQSDDFKKKNEDFDQQRAGLLTRATDSANGERDRLLGEARKEGEALKDKLTQQIQSQQQNLDQELTTRAEKEGLAIARKTLADLADVDLDRRATDVFLERLKTLSPEQRDHLKDPKFLIRSAFPLAPAQQSALKTALGGPEIDFETSPGLIAGIELSANGKKLAWSADGYLSDLEKQYHAH